MVLGVVLFQGPVPAYVAVALGTGDRGRGGGLLAVMMSASRAGGFGGELVSLEFVQLLAERGVAMVVAVTATDDMGTMLFMMLMHGGLVGVPLVEVVRVGARDNRMRGDGAAAETRALDGGRRVGRHSLGMGIGRGTEYHGSWTCRMEKASSVYTAPLKHILEMRR